MGRLEYSSNNSGGHWWLKDADWKALEEAGWTVDWYKDQELDFFRPDKDGRWLGALASNASIETDNFEVALGQWSEITGQYPDDEGCHCCGQPHNFTFYDDNGNSRYRYIETNPRGYWS